MVVAVIAVAVMQPAVDQEVYVVAVGHGGMAAVIVGAGALHRSAVRGIGRAHGDDMRVVVALVRMMQVAVV